MELTDQQNREEIIENWDHPLEPHESTNLYKLLQVLVSENERLDIELDGLYDNRFIDTATGTSLEKIGDLVGVNRKTGEKDEKLRKRIRGAFAAQASDTTYESFANAALSILDSSPDNVGFATPPETPKKTVELRMDGGDFENNPLTEDELIVLLNGALSIDAQVIVKLTGTFAFDGDDTSLEGFDEGTWSVKNS
jgi:hypothetical protein